MHKNVSEFIMELTRLSSGILDVYNENVEYWSPDLPPETTILSDIGRRIVNDFDVMDSSVRASIFEHIERAMEGPSEGLRTAVATGLIEGMAGRAVRTGKWGIIRAVLGTRSGVHADAWVRPES